MTTGGPLKRQAVVRAALVGGPMYDPLYESIPAFEGVWAAGQIGELHNGRRTTSTDLESWHYDEISASFRRGEAALVADWPGSYHLYKDRATCEVWDRIGLALLPAGPAGERAAYAGCHSFAIPRSARNRGGGAVLLRFLTSFEQQLGEARRGAIPCRTSALRSIRSEAESKGTGAPTIAAVEASRRGGLPQRDSALDSDRPTTVS